MNYEVNLGKILCVLVDKGFLKKMHSMVRNTHILLHQQITRKFSAKMAN